MDSGSIRNALTIDVEDYFHVSAFEAQITRADWERMPSRVERNVDVILDLLDRHRTSATFFVLGWVAERFPTLVRRIVERGHELGCHGYAHQRASVQSRKEFREDVAHAKGLLEDIGGVGVIGYRAPSFSINHSNLWTLEYLSETGFRYSSSVYPIRHDHYGMPEAPRFAFYPEHGRGILEIPVTTTRLFNRNLPAGGGGYFRLLPYGVSRWCLKRVNIVDRQPCIFYFHPWEIDHDQPRIAGVSLKTRFRHYVNLRRTKPRLEQLLTDFRWDTVQRAFGIIDDEGH